MRWWQKSAENDQLSLFGKGLRLCTQIHQDPRSRPLETLLQSALSEAVSLDAGIQNPLLAFLLKSLVQNTKTNMSQDADYLPSSSPSRQNYFLRAPVSGQRSPSQGRSWSRDPEEVYTCSDDCAWQPSDALFGFLDNCLTRLAKRTVKYDQDLLELRTGCESTVTLEADMVAGNLLMVVLEQWPFIQTLATVADAENISHWLTRFLLIVVRNGGNLELINRVRGKLESVTRLESCHIWLRKAPDGHFIKGVDFEAVQQPSRAAPAMTNVAAGNISGGEVAKEEWEPPTPPASEGEDHPGLGKWKQFGIEEGIMEGAIGELILCLCSQYAEIRRQALMELRRWMKTLQTSQYSEREAMYLLVGELIETCQSCVGDGALAGFVGAMAAESCLVLSDPLHILYAKVNRFLNKGP
ncbi:MAG: hypothetical protein Q9204_008676, partial [Flavoplaca sp. TL-2023a]